MFTMITQNWTYELSFAGLLVLFSWMVWEYFVTPKNLPPGPWGLPIIGYLPFLGAKPHVTLTYISMKYGDVFKFFVGKHTIIVLSSYNVLKEAFVKQADAFSGRPRQFSMRIPRDISGIIKNDGESWAELRRFSLITLKDFGFGRTTLEPQLKEEIQQFLEVIKLADGKPVEIGELLHLSVTNIICTLITGRRMEYYNPTLNELLELTKQQIISIGFGKVENLLPSILRKPGLTKLIGIKSPIESIARTLKIFSDIVERHVKVLRSDSRDNFIDCWLTELENQDQKTTLLTKKQLPTVLRDLLAGSYTTTNTLTWILLYVVQYPKVQEKIQHEIDEIIGRERTPTMSDQKSMPYTCATLMEVIRLVSLIPLSILHRCTKDSTLNGYFIPKDAVIVPNFWAVHHDPKIFPEPDEFKPERFLQDDKLQIKKMEEFLPFSIGKRLCMGESLARMELFLYLTSILQHFTLKSVNGVPLDFDYDFAIISIPKPQELCFIPR